MTLKALCIYWLPVIVWAALISFFSTSYFSGEHTGHLFTTIIRWFWPGISVEILDLLHHIVRKLAHITEYCILSLFLFRALRGGRATAWKMAWFWTCLMSVVAYASLDEIHQSFVKGRDARLGDVGFDTLGGVIGQVIVWIRNCFWFHDA